MTYKTRVLFVCTANAARSQMAEGLLRAKYGDRYEVCSAGTRQAKVSTRAVAVMQEIGIDISHHRSKTLTEYGGTFFDLAVTLCDNAHALCPVVSGAKKTIHYGFPDPHLTPGSRYGLILHLENSLLNNPLFFTSKKIDSMLSRSLNYGE